MMPAPEPTTAELDEWEYDFERYRYSDAARTRIIALRIIKALRACRQEAKAKDAVIEAADEVATRLLVLVKVGKLQLDPGLTVEHRKLLDALAALDNPPSVAKQGETDAE